ncbi:DUF4256 domain-containing protein [Paenimyroides aestuarii]|uniref:DUF4256 domain-containing protein n=1 Tax=Paenimyroides aestuarii TaxID=2968490 RepID=A0ABY5NVY8_9FLAO|nr:DUF4256 domain-containing protein [Paenimyroides aestuarii]UUV22778.1 DUF4256 domain-containing protein [Paenimyroides aestuarii]
MKSKLSAEEQSIFLDTLKKRFAKNRHRHKNIDWNDVETKLQKNPSKIDVLLRMEETGGEPDVVVFEEKSNEIVFCDCSKESPKGRRSFCYDRPALDARKEHKPANNVIDSADEIGIKLLNEEEYHALQALEAFDTKTSTWIETPQKIRDLGGALFGDFRYDTVFFYHNGASSYYAARGFRGLLKI